MHTKRKLKPIVRNTLIGVIATIMLVTYAILEMQSRFDAYVALHGVAPW